MNPKQLEWLAHDRAADWRREAAAERVLQAARSAEPGRTGLRSTLAARRGLPQSAVRMVLTALHLVRPSGRAVS
jgi:hypothetical protein